MNWQGMWGKQRLYTQTHWWGDEEQVRRERREEDEWDNEGEAQRRKRSRSLTLDFLSSRQTTLTVNFHSICLRCVATQIQSFSAVRQSPPVVFWVRHGAVWKDDCDAARPRISRDNYIIVHDHHHYLGPTSAGSAWRGVRVRRGGLGPRS